MDDSWRLDDKRPDPISEAPRLGSSLWHILCEEIHFRMFEILFQKRNGYAEVMLCTYATVCPKVAEKSNVPCFSAICAWILKPFDLQIAMMVRFVMMYDNP